MFPTTQYSHVNDGSVSDQYSKKNEPYVSNEIFRETLSGVIENQTDFSIFYKILRKSSYYRKFSDPNSNYTLLVPSDKEILNRYPSGYFSEIHKGIANRIIEQSTMKTQVDQHLIQRYPIITISTLDRSNSIRFVTDNDVTCLGKIKIIHFNHLCNNGLIHVIDDVIY
jgi:hypothetical protein